MYLVTGGAGFIGSNVVAALSERQEEVVVCDWLRDDERWRNLAKHEVSEIIEPEALPAWLQRKGRRLRGVVHMGAISATTETNVDLIAARNIRSTLDLLEWCTDAQLPFIYASSAATYGDGTQGFDDDFDRGSLAKLLPLNAYGWSKHLIDRRLARMVETGAKLPPQWAGLKFFNVYGPNEYHKGSMISVIARNFPSVRGATRCACFAATIPTMPMAARNAISSMCATAWTSSCGSSTMPRCPACTTSHGAGANLDGSGQRPACGARPDCACEIVDMPAELQSKYQYFTQARMDRLREAGYRRPFTSLEDGIGDYVERYLNRQDPYR